jgi:cytosine/adenosine deaminase-related metal-dependent hydrolase
MRLLIQARNRCIGVEDGRITAPDGGFDCVLRFPEAEVRPGLINAHDHLHRNHYGRLGRPPYCNAYEWAFDIQVRFQARIDEGRRRSRREALLEGAWKNLCAGVTTVVHHDPWEADFDDDFPLHVVRVRNADSLGMTPDLEGFDGEGPCCLHLAEGTGPEMAEEVRALAGRGLLGPELIAVHGIGVDADGAGLFRAAGAALVWCPSSNFFLFGRTAPDTLLGQGVDVLLGSDSRLTGAGDLLDELRCARAHGALDDDRLVDAVGATAARRLGLPEPSLEPGAPADLVLLSRPLLEASTDDVVLVLVDGAPRVAANLDELAPDAKRRTIGSRARWTSRGMATPTDRRALQ